MVKTVKVNDEYWESIESVADQLNTTNKAVINAILEWFFSTPSAGPLEAFEELYEEEET